MPQADKKYPPVVVVDESDNEIGSAMLADVWRQGLYHRVATVSVIDDHGRMLLQLRSPQVKIYPNMWDYAVGGHVDIGQTYEEAAHKEIAEEIGLHDVKLEVLGTIRTNLNLDDGRILNQFERTYLLRVPYDIALKPEPEEVSKLQWFAPEELKTHIAQHSEEFTPVLLSSMRKYFPEFQ